MEIPYIFKITKSLQGCRCNAYNCQSKASIEIETYNGPSRSTINAYCNSHAEMLRDKLAAFLNDASQQTIITKHEQTCVQCAKCEQDTDVEHVTRYYCTDSSNASPSDRVEITPFNVICQNFKERETSASISP